MTAESRAKRHLLKSSTALHESLDFLVNCPFPCQDFEQGTSLYTLESFCVSQCTWISLMCLECKESIRKDAPGFNHTDSSPEEHFCLRTHAWFSSVFLNIQATDIHGAPLSAPSIATRKAMDSVLASSLACELQLQEACQFMTALTTIPLCIACALSNTGLYSYSGALGKGCLPQYYPTWF